MRLISNVKVAAESKKRLSRRLRVILELYILTLDNGDSTTLG